MRSVGICLQDPHAEIDLHCVVVSPSARIGEPGDDSGGLGIEGRVTHILGPDGAGGKVRRRRRNVIQLGRP